MRSKITVVDDLFRGPPHAMACKGSCFWWYVSTLDGHAGQDGSDVGGSEVSQKINHQQNLLKNTHKLQVPSIYESPISILFMDFSALTRKELQQTERGVPKLSKTHATFFGVRVTAADMDNCMYVMYNTVHIVYIVVGVGYHTVCICCT